MRILGAFVLFFLYQSAFAQLVPEYSVNATFIEPVTNEDGSPLTDLAYYDWEIVRGPVNSEEVLNSGQLQAQLAEPPADSQIAAELGPVNVASGDVLRVKLRACDDAVDPNTQQPAPNCSIWAVSNETTVPDVNTSIPNLPEGLILNISIVINQQ